MTITVAGFGPSRPTARTSLVRPLARSLARRASTAMPAKRKAAAKPKAEPSVAKSEPSVAQDPVPPGPALAPLEISNFNATWMQEMPALIRKITARLGEDIVTQDPIALQNGALQAPFVLADYQRAIGAGLPCQFGANLFWMDMNIDPLIAHIPIKTGRVKKLAETRFATPVPIPAVTVAVHRAFNPLESKGKCRRLSPSEHVFAALVAIARDVDAQNDAAIDQWQEFLLSTTFSFRVIENNDDFVFAHMQLREDAAIDYELVRMSALARMVDVSVYCDRVFRERGVRLSAVQLSNEFGRLKLAESSEAISDTFVELALNVHNKLVVRAPGVFTMLLKMDDELGVNNPLDGITKVHGLLTRFKERVVWGFELLVDLYNNGGLRNEQFSVRNLKGSGPVAQAKGLADVIYTKYDILQHLLEWIADQKIDTSVKQKIRDISTNVKTFRDHAGCSWNSSAKPSDKKWKSSWSDAANHMVALVETVVFSTCYDDIILQNIKHKKGIPSLLEQSPLDELITEITDSLHAASESKTSEKDEHEAPPADKEPDEDTTRVQHDTNNHIHADPVVTQARPNLDEDQIRKLERFQHMAQELVASHVTFVHEGMGEQQQLDTLKASPAGTERGSRDNLSHVLIWHPMC